MKLGKHLIFVGAVIAVLCTGLSSAHARRYYRHYYAGDGALSKTFGIGLVLGDPSGLSAELRLGGHTSLDLAVGVDRWYGNDLYVHADYLVYLVNLANGGSVDVPIYLGVGPVIWQHDDPNGNLHVGARVPIGIAIALRRTPVQFFFELAPRLFIFHTYQGEGRFDLTGALGFRIYF
jgi:hypothetical protein